MPTPENHLLRRRFGLSALVIAAGVIVVASTCLAFLARMHWGCDLFTHFRVQYFISLLMAALLLVRRHKRWATLFAIFAMVNLYYIAPFYFSQSERDEPVSRGTVRALLLNVNSTHGDIARTMDAIREADPDLIVMLEVNGRWSTHIESVKDAYPMSVVRPREDNFGIAVLSKLELAETDVLFLEPAEVPTITATVKVGDKKLTLIATHPLPPAGTEYSKARNEQLKGLAHISATAEFPVLLLSDLNVTPWSPHFQDLLRNGSLNDSMRGHGIQPSWPTWMPIFFVPIDHCLHGDGIRILNRRLGPYVRSDHLPVIVDLSIL